jgi:hypothetical protein
VEGESSAFVDHVDREVLIPAATPPDQLAAAIGDVVVQVIQDCNRAAGASDAL